MVGLGMYARVTVSRMRHRLMGGDTAGYERDRKEGRNRDQYYLHRLTS